MLAIRNYGLFWRSDTIFWGWEGVAGHLKGEDDNGGVADFRQQSGVYILYNQNRRPIRVGQAGSGNRRLFDRLKDHIDDADIGDRWEYFSWFGLHRANADGSLSLADREDRRFSGSVANALDEIEAVLISGLDPHFNKRGPNWGDTKRFFQIEDARLSHQMSAASVRSVDRKLDELLALVRQMQRPR